MKTKIYKSVSDLVGNTPLIELSNYRKKYNIKSRILGKLESYNPAGSIKDRVAKQIIEDGLESGKINKKTTIIEATSGNTGIGLASLAAAYNLDVIIVMPDTMSIERRTILKAYGVDLVLTEGSLGMNGAIAKAKEIQKENPNSFMASQFTTPSNPKAHLQNTGPEIWRDTEGEVDILVSGIGTGGTITGAGKYLKSKNPDIKIIAVEPVDSPFLTKGTGGPHKIQGIGAGFKPEVLDSDIYDEILTVSNEDAMIGGRDMGSQEGILVGISSGAALHAAKIIGNRPENKDKNIVVILPDTGERYLSTDLFSFGDTNIKNK